MATTMDALASVKHLVDNLPLWLLKLDELSTQVTQLPRRKAGSIKSLQSISKAKTTDDHKVTAAEATANTISSREPQQSQANDVLAIKQAHRKRKRGSAPSITSGPLIICYDSNIQDAFVLLFQNVASARYNLEKGKTAAIIKAPIASLGVGGSPFTTGGR